MKQEDEENTPYPSLGERISHIEFVPLITRERGTS